MDFNQRIKAKYIVTSAPRRVDHLEHELVHPEKNREAAQWLESKSVEILYQDSKGSLNLYDTSIVFLETNTEAPISFFLNFRPLHRGILLEQIWKRDSAKAMRINSLPLGVYCLFEELLPRYGIVVLGEENTPEGEKWTKSRTEDAIKRGLYVYLTNEHGTLFEAKTWNEVKKRETLLWGKKDAKFLSRTIILSTTSLD